MRNKFIVLLLLSQVTLFIKINAQNIAINSTGNLPDTSAMLDVSSTTKGLLAPRMTTVQQNAIPLPATGLLIFNTTDNGFKVNTGTPGTPVWTSLVTGSGVTTNTLTSFVNNMTNTTNGVAATAPIVNSNSLSLSGSTLTSTVNGVASGGLNLSPAITAATTNTLNSAANTLTNTTNGVAATAPIVNSNGLSLSGSTLTSTVNGIASGGLNLTPAITAATTNTLSSSGNTMTNTTNGVAATAPIVNSVSNNSATNTLSTTVNGVTGAGVAIINSNTLTNPTNTITSTVNGVSTTAPAVNTVSNTSVTNTLKTIVNGVTSAGITMINSNALSITGNNLTSTINGVASTALDISGIVNEPWYNVATGTAATSNTQNIYQMGNVGIGLNNPAYQLGVKDNMEIRRVGSLAQLLFTNTGGSGDFRFGGDGGDIFWQGGGGRSLQMGSYWSTILGGDRQTATFPAFASGISGTSVIVAAQRDASVALGVQANSAGQTANLTEWRSSDGTALSVIDESGNLGLGVTNPSQKLHVNGQAIITTLNAGAGTDDIITVDGTGLLKKRSVASIASGATITSLNGLTNTTQTFAAGTAGNDFAISSSGTVHTFNLPTASSTKRGALSSADWSTFNNKQGAITLTTLGFTGVSTFAGNVLNIPNYTLAGLGGIGYGALSASAPLNYNNLTGNFSITQATNAANGYLSSTDWNTFNNKQTALSGSGYTRFSGSTPSYISAIPNGDLANSAITIQGTSTSLGGTVNIINGTGFVKASGTTISYDNSTYVTTAGARTAISLTTTGTSGAATYNNSTGVLNIPVYAGAGWALSGNTGITQPAAPATYGTSALGATENFIGTKDAKDLVFATSNLERMRVLNTNGYVGIGTAAPSKPLDIVQNLSNAGLMKIQNTSTSGYSSIDIWSNTTQVGNIGFSNGGAAYPNSFYFATNTTNNMVFATNNVERVRIDGSNGNIGIGVATPTADLHLAAGANTAGNAPLKFSSGTNLSTPENGAMEYDGTSYFVTSGGTRYTLAKTLTGTATNDFPNTGSFASNTFNITVTGAVDGDAVSLGVSNNAASLTGAIYTAYVSAANTVTVKIYNATLGNINPPSATFDVSVIKF